MRKTVTSLAALTAMAAGAAVLQLKMTIQEKEEAMRATAQQIHDDQEAIRILEAEWSYLTTPGVLQERSVKFLALMPPHARQVLHNPVVVPFRPEGVMVPKDEAPSILLPTSVEKKAKPKKKTGGAEL